jgi:hypothetical protein
MPDNATLSVAVAPVAATNQLEIMACELDRKNAKLHVRYRIVGSEPRVVTIALGAAAMNALNTAIANAIKADIAGNPDVNLT